MKSIDIKSLLIGILGTALVMLLMRQTTNYKGIGIFQTACAKDWCFFYNTITGIGHRFDRNKLEYDKNVVIPF